MTVRVLCLNAGSSSLKFTLYDAGEAGQQRLIHGAVEDIGGAEQAHGWWQSGQGGKHAVAVAGESMDAALATVFDSLAQGGMPSPQVVGHRVVHGGPDHFRAELVTPALLQSLRDLVPLAPLHLPGGLAGMEAVTQQFPDLPQVACFDTAFHRRMPELARRYPLPDEYFRQGMQRYGFHGLSYEYILDALGEKAKGRLIIAHLGNGASMAACRDGEPMDTTMGLTPTGGLMMGTRTGDLDPGVVLHLLRQGYSRERLESLLNKQSGLRGVSGLSEDMQTLLEQREQDGSAALAVDLYCYLARKQLGALAATLGGLDQLVFTAGVGEHAAPIRAGICEGMDFLGIELDTRRNEAGEALISVDGSRCTVRLMATDEDRMIARHAVAALARQ